jgi:glutamate racemase
MIGVFDSGYGGLTILKGFLKRLPQYDYMYLGDNARAPYGSKSQEVVYSYTAEAVDFLFRQGCGLIIVACNTASSKALREIQQKYLPGHHPGKRVLGVVIPIAEEAAKLTKTEKVGVVGTRGTITSGTYDIEIKKLNSKLRIYSQACPLLVPLIEEGWSSKPETKMILKKYLRPLKQAQIDTLILGCTHYPFLIKDFSRIMTKRVKVLDSPKIVAEKLADYLERHPEIESGLEKNGKRAYYTTDDPDRFKDFSKKYLKSEIKNVMRASL